MCVYVSVCGCSLIYLYVYMYLFIRLSVSVVIWCDCQFSCYYLLVKSWSHVNSIRLSALYRFIVHLLIQLLTRELKILSWWTVDYLGPAFTHTLNMLLIVSLLNNSIYCYCISSYLTRLLYYINEKNEYSYIMFNTS